VKNEKDVNNSNTSKSSIYGNTVNNSLNNSANVKTNNGNSIRR